ncbi:MAG: branched-chain amino acid ABC transporter permease [Candidatus Sumerlaeaceae bacterium]
MMDQASRKLLVLRRALPIVGFVAFVFVAPWMLHSLLSPTGYTNGINILILGGYSAIGALGLNIIVGYCGLLNLGFAGFMLIGAYTAGILMRDFHFSFWLAMLASVVHGAFWGVVLGLPTLRLTGDYFAIVTFGFGELVNMVARNSVSITGGPRGFPRVPRPSLWIPGVGHYEFSILGTHRNAYWYLVAALLGVTMFVAHRLLRSRLGRAWTALREDEVAAEACGINAMWYKTIAFAISAAIGALAGAFVVSYFTMADYRNFDFMVSVSVLAYLVLGGMGTVIGPVVGAVVLVALGELLRQSPAMYLADVMKWWPEGATWLRGLPWVPDMRMISYGIILVLMIRFRPEGLLPSGSRRRGLRGTRPRGGAEVSTSLFELREQ